MWCKRLPFFYGWMIVAVVFVCLAIGYAGYHSFSIFYVAILNDFGWSRASTAGALSLFSLVYGFASPVSGALVDRFGPRAVLPSAAIVLGLGLLLLTRMSSIWEFYLLYGLLVALGLNCIGIVPNFAVVSNWFVKKRGSAWGIAVAGVGVGTFFLVPILQRVITDHGWRTAYTVLAVAVVLVIPALYVGFLRHRPRDVNMLPDGERSEKASRLARPDHEGEDALILDWAWASREWTLASAVLTRQFWYASVGRFLEMICLGIFMTHQAAFFVDLGYDRMLAASIVGMVGLVGSGGKILWGLLSDRFGRESTYIMAYAAGTVGVVLLLSIQSSSPTWLLYCYATSYGLCYAASTALFPVLTGDLFQGKQYGSILGGAYASGGMGLAIGAFLGGYVFDLTGGYHPAFALAIPALWLSCALYWLAAPRKVRMVAGKARSAVQLHPRRTG